MRVLGIDPDTQNTGAAVCEDGELISVGRMECNRTGNEALVYNIDRGVDFFSKFNEVDVICIESQQVTSQWTRKGVNSNHIVQLARVCGAMLACAKMVSPDARVLLPLPREWKGTIPKTVTHERIAKKHNFIYEKSPRHVKVLSVPDSVELKTVVELSNWTHVLDAVGLADYGSLKAARF